MAQNTTAINKPKILSLQAVRGIAFLSIFLCHAGVPLFGACGAWGVSIFFVLSGFVMFYNYENREMGLSLKGSFLFSVKKIAKLYPLHLLMLLLPMLLILMELAKNFSGSALLQNVKLFGVHALLLQAWVPKSTVYFSLNGVAWYLSACVFLYMAFPYVLRLMKHHTGVKTACLGMLIIDGLQAVFAVWVGGVNVPLSLSDNFSAWAPYIFPLYRLGDFALGCHLCYIFVHGKFQPGKWLATLGEVLVIGLIVISQYLYCKNLTVLSELWCRNTLLFLPTSLLFIYLFAVNKGMISRLCTNKLLIYIGEISAYAFLVHQLALQYLPSKILAFVVTWLLAVIYREVVHRLGVRRVQEKEIPKA